MNCSHITCAQHHIYIYIEITEPQRSQCAATQPE